MKKFVMGAVLSLGVLAATAAPAAASGMQYTGYWYYTKAQCEKAWSDMHGGGQLARPHECKPRNGVWELWAWA